VRASHGDGLALNERLDVGRERLAENALEAVAHDVLAALELLEDRVVLADRGRSLQLHPALAQRAYDGPVGRGRTAEARDHLLEVDGELGALLGDAQQERAQRRIDDVAGCEGELPARVDARLDEAVELHSHVQRVHRRRRRCGHRGRHR
jgi:hypothetical protein